MAWHPVARTSDLKPGDVVAVEVEGVAMVVGRDGDRYFAAQRQCVHRGGDLSEGIIARGHLVCAHHGWRFSTSNGRHDSMTDICLVVYAVRVVDDRILVDPEPRTLRGH